MKLLSTLYYASKIKVISNVAKSTKISDTEKLKKAELVKKLNKENKLLFGPVIKTKKKGKEKQAYFENSVEHGRSSEQYWLIHHKSNIRITEKSDENASQEKSTNAEKNSLKFTINEQLQNIRKIPFSSKGIKQIFTFPLVVGEKKILIENNQEYIDTLPSVSKILSTTISESSRKALMEWKLSIIRELGEDGFHALQQEHFRKGKELHKALESYLKSNIEPKAETEVFATWKSISPILKELQPKAELIEASVEHPFLKYKGVVDCVSHVGTNLSVMEWKKSDKPKTSAEKTYDAPIQLAAYLGALNCDPKYDFSIKTGYVVVAYTNSKPGNFFHFNELDMQKYWQIWLQRLQEYWVRTRDGTLPDPI